jgi:hypothetical protein
MRVRSFHYVIHEWTDADTWTRLNHDIGMGYQINQNIILTGDLNSDLFTSHNNKLIAVLRIRSRFLISLLSSLLNHGRSLLCTVTILVGIHSLVTRQSDIDKYKKQRNKVNNLKKDC